MGVTAYLDASVLVRYLIGRPLDAAAMAIEIVDGVEELVITEGEILETAYVLRSRYKTPREAVVDSLIAVLRKANVRSQYLDKDLLIAALLLCRPSGRISPGDALLWANARAINGPVYTFDRRFPRDGIEIRNRA